jgi:hypothetical protein
MEKLNKNLACDGQRLEGMEEGFVGGQDPQQKEEECVRFQVVRVVVM